MYGIYVREAWDRSMVFFKKSKFWGPNSQVGRHCLTSLYSLETGFSFLRAWCLDGLTGKVEGWVKTLGLVLNGPCARPSSDSVAEMG